MSERARALAQQFERTNEDFVAVLETLSNTDWQARCEPEGWPVGFTAHHVGRWHGGIAAWVRAVATGQPPSMTRAEVDQTNNREFAERSTYSREEVVARLRHEAEDVARFVRTLTDEQLDRAGPAFLESAWNPRAEDIIVRILIDHISHHAASIKAATSR